MLRGGVHGGGDELGILNLVGHGVGNHVGEDESALGCWVHIDLQAFLIFFLGLNLQKIPLLEIDLRRRHPWSYGARSSLRSKLSGVLL